MKSWDFSSGAAKLELAMKSIQIADAEVQEFWNDAAHQKFQETYLEPLEPKIRGMLEAIHRIAEVFDIADRQCGIS
jgi:uncharacterized protein YukE